MPETANCAEARNVYVKLSINFQYGTRAGLEHTGETPEGN